MTSDADESLPEIPDVTIDGLPARLRDAVGRAGWTTLMPVQARAIPRLIAKRNLMIQARTGSGKTGAFLLPLLERLDGSRNECQALVLVPTRELARQVWQDAETLLGGSGLRAVAVYGGVGYGAAGGRAQGGRTPRRRHARARARPPAEAHVLARRPEDADLRRGGPHAVDGLLPRHAPVEALPAEARTAHLHVLGHVPGPGDPDRAASSSASPSSSTLSSDHVHVSEVEHVSYLVEGMDKDRSLVRLIEIENPASAIIFCNTKARVNYVTVVLQRFGYDADELSSDLSQGQREDVLDRVRKRALRFLVATDVAARGLDIPDLSHVIQYEPPEDVENYVHRAGRTGRAGASGTAISLVNSGERFALERIVKAYKIEMQARPDPHRRGRGGRRGRAPDGAARGASARAGQAADRAQRALRVAGPLARGREGRVAAHHDAARRHLPAAPARARGRAGRRARAPGAAEAERAGAGSRRRAPPEVGRGGRAAGTASREPERQGSPHSTQAAQYAGWA